MHRRRAAGVSAGSGHCEILTDPGAQLEHPLHSCRSIGRGRIVAKIGVDLCGQGERSGMLFKDYIPYPEHFGPGEEDMSLVCEPAEEEDRADPPVSVAAYPSPGLVEIVLDVGLVDLANVRDPLGSGPGRETVQGRSALR